MTPEQAFHALVAGTDDPVYIVTTAAGGELSGCLVGFASQASIKPPRLLMLISKVNHTYGVALRARMLAVHFPHTGNERLAALFGEETGDSTDKFTRCRWQADGDGLPILAGTRGWVTGAILERFDCGDHVGHLIDVRRAALERNGDSEQLSFRQVRGLHPGHPA